MKIYPPFRNTLVSMLLSSRFILQVRSLATTKQQLAAASSLSSLLVNPELVPVPSSDTPTFEVRNPAQPDSVVGRVQVMKQQDVQGSIEKSHDQLGPWRDGTTARERSRLLQQWSRLIGENAPDIATVMTLESGKPLKECQGEVTYARSFLEYYAAEATRPTGAGGGFLVPTPFADQHGAPRGQIMALQQAVGVTAMITPWNFPLAMITRKVGPALAAGCTAVLKPSELTPLSALCLERLATEAGIPSGVFQVVTPDSASTPEVGTELCTHPLVQKISFTGSVPVGKQLMRLASDTVKRVSLELGGNAPFVVFEDADLDQAVNALIASKYRAAGQTCVCADRILVHSAVYNEFLAKFTERVQNIVVGPGIEESTTMGPLISADSVEKLHGKVREALAEGASCVLGGSRMDQLGPHFYEPTILTNVSPTSRIWKTETFGPVAAVRSFDTEQEALQLVNDSNVGLAAYFCTSDLNRAFRFSRQLECGIVGVNEGIISTTMAPFGGVKESGLGREGSPLGLSEYLETKYVFVNA